jgi:putative acetyltransferase
MKVEVRRTSSHDVYFRELVRELDADLAVRYGEDQAFFDQFNHVEKITEVIVVAYNGAPVGCGAIKKHGPLTCELKRMYVRQEHRGKGLGRTIVSALETWARGLGYETVILETGKNQPEAIALYQRMGYGIIPNYDQYIGVDLSVCMGKQLV